MDLYIFNHDMKLSSLSNVVQLLVIDTGLVSALVLKKMSSIARVQDRKTAENLENHSK